MTSPEPLLPPDLLTPEPPLTREDLDGLVDLVLNPHERFGPDGFQVIPYDADPPDAGAQVFRWRIDGPGSAEWAMAHLAELDANLAALKDQRTAYVERIDAWHEDAARRLKVSRAFFAGHLEEYARALREADDKATKVRTPSGTVSTTRHSPKIEVADEAALIAWVDEHLGSAAIDAVVKTVQSVRVSELRKIIEPGVTTTGRWEVELSCGCTLTFRPENPEVVPTVGSSFECHGAHAGADIAPTVIVAGWEQTLAPVAPSGEIVPGAVVVPEHVTAKATPS